MTTWNASIHADGTNSIAPARFTKTLAGALSALSVSPSAATVASPTTRTPAWTEPSLLGRTISVTSTTSAATYNTANPIVVTGLDVYGNVQTANLLLQAAGGNETVTTTVAFAAVTSIAIPTQLGTGGTLTFTTKDVVLPKECREVRVGTAGGGALHVGYVGEDGTILQDTIPSFTAAERHSAAVKWIYLDSTVQDLTFYW